VDAVTWYINNSGLVTHDVGLKNPNFLGIYDMSGNIRELCWDSHAVYTTVSPYSDSNTRGPDVTGGNRVVRGGGYAGGSVIQVADRWVNLTNETSLTMGFRIVRLP
jgi:formylglycine-generating enzyme